MLTFEGGRGQVFIPLNPPIILSKHVYQNTGMSSLANMVVFSLEENSLYPSTDFGNISLFNTDQRTRCRIWPRLSSSCPVRQHT
jgi:hypothetical protein